MSQYPTPINNLDQFDVDQAETFQFALEPVSVTGYLLQVAKKEWAVGFGVFLKHQLIVYTGDEEKVRLEKGLKALIHRDDALNALRAEIVTAIDEYVTAQDLKDDQLVPWRAVVDWAYTLADQQDALGPESYFSESTHWYHQSTESADRPKKPGRPGYQVIPEHLFYASRWLDNWRDNAVLDTDCRTQYNGLNTAYKTQSPEQVCDLINAFVEAWLDDDDRRRMKDAIRRAAYNDKQKKNVDAEKKKGTHLTETAINILNNINKLDSECQTQSDVITKHLRPVLNEFEEADRAERSRKFAEEIKALPIDEFLAYALWRKNQSNGDRYKRELDEVVKQSSLNRSVIAKLLLAEYDYYSDDMSLALFEKDKPKWLGQAKRNRTNYGKK